MLMHLYVMLEMEEPMLQLHEKYGSYEETQMLFPLSILYFKLGDFEKSAEYLKRLYQVNPDIKQLVKMVLENQRISQEAHPFFIHIAECAELH